MRRYSLLLLLLAALSTRLTAQLAVITNTATERLFQVLRSGNTDTLQQLLVSGANPNDSLNGYSALMAAALNGSVGQMKILIDHGANVNDTTREGISAIWLAVPDTNKTRLLLAHGADIRHQVDGYGVLAKLASIPGSIGVFRELIQKGADLRRSAPCNYMVYAAASSGDTAILGYLLQCGFSANDSTDFGDYPINAAQSFRSFPTLKMLVDNGANVNQQPLHIPGLQAMVGFTPLMMAALNNDKPSLFYLLDHGASPAPKNKMGYTALMLLQQSEIDDPEMTLALLNHGADPAAKTPDGSDAYSFALKRGNTQSAAILQKYSTR